MLKTLGLYISASEEMDAECELVGQMLAGLLKSTEWRIKRTPGAHEYGNPDLVALASSNFYLILMGTDITAPIGVELDAAKRSGSLVYAYRRADAPLTPAAGYFMRNSGLHWRSYASLPEFIVRLERSLVEQMIKGTPGYGLDLHDIEQLSARLQQMREDEPTSEEEQRRGAGYGGVILTDD